jgi:hypothetical protein
LPELKPRWQYAARSPLGGFVFAHMLRHALGSAESIFSSRPALCQGRRVERLSRTAGALVDGDHLAHAGGARPALRPMRSNALRDNPRNILAF